MRPLLPTLREKKRYVAFEVSQKTSFQDVSRAIWSSVLNLVGTHGAGEMGLRLLPDSFNGRRGLARVTHTNVNAFKASLTFIENIGGKSANARSVGVSGMLNKAQTKYIEEG